MSRPIERYRTRPSWYQKLMMWAFGLRYALVWFDITDVSRGVRRIYTDNDGREYVYPFGRILPTVRQYLDECGTYNIKEIHYERRK